MLKLLEDSTSHQLEPAKCAVKGNIPPWIQGSLYRMGPGMYQLGPDEINHYFDGMALAHRFHIQNGKVTYQNRTVNSNSYQRNKAANRLISGEFGTVGMPDPCKSVFSRYFSYYLSLNGGDDNTLVNITRCGDQLYSMSEMPLINQIDPENLERIRMVDMSKHVAIHWNTAHPLQDSLGDIYNIGTRVGAQAYYSVVRVPKPLKGDQDPIQSIEHVGQMASSQGKNPCYSHSFGLTDNYIIYTEQPLVVSTWTLATGKLTGIPFRHALSFKQGEKVKFLLMNKKTGAAVETRYVASCFFTFHHINAYEEDNHVVLDISAYDDASSIDGLDFRVLKASAASNKPFSVPYVGRFILPLNPEKEAKGNLVTLVGAKAVAEWTSEGEIHCVPHIVPKAFMELPRINETLTGKKYRYAYGVYLITPNRSQLQKVDFETDGVLTWEEEGLVASEPVFLPAPKATKEDDGVILCPVTSATDGVESFLVLLDASSFKEIGRAHVPITVSLPFTFHGLFTNMSERHAVD